MDHKMQIDKKNIAAKPRKLITISRSNLTMLETKILNYFIWRHYWGAYENPEYKIRRETLEVYIGGRKISGFIRQTFRNISPKRTDNMRRRQDEHRGL